MSSRPNWTASPSTSAWGGRREAKAVRRLLLWCFRNRETGAITVAQTPNLALTGQGNGAMKTLTLAALAMTLRAARRPACMGLPVDLRDDQRQGRFASHRPAALLHAWTERAGGPACLRRKDALHSGRA